MVTDYPDFLGFPGRAGAGEEVIAYSFTGSIAADTTGYFDLVAVPVGYENVFQSIAVSCNDDTSIHKVELINTNIPWTWFVANFITADKFDFPGHAFAAGVIIRVKFTNRSSSALTFEGAIFYTKRPV